MGLKSTYFSDGLNLGDVHKLHNSNEEQNQKKPLQT